MLRKFRLRKLIAISLILEIILFPWINAYEQIEVIFYTLFIVNVLIGLFSIKKENLILNKIDYAFSIFILFTLINPYNFFLFEFSANAPYVRLFAFFLRYLTLDIKLLKENSNLFSIGILVSSVMVIFLFPIEKFSNNFRLFFPYGDPNYVSFIFGSYALIIYSFFYNGLKKNLSSQINVIAIIICLIIVILTASRGGLLSFAITLIFLIKRNISIPKLILLGSLVLLVVSTFNFNFNFINDINAFNRFLNPVKSDVGALNSRFQETAVTFDSFTNNPQLYIFGNGLGSSNITSNTYSHQFRIHNTFVSVFNDSGIIGLIFFLIFIFRLFYYNFWKASIFLFLFIMINSQTIYLLTIYQFHICLKFLTQSKKST